MKSKVLLKRILFVLSLSLTAAALFSQVKQSSPVYEPVIGQKGKDVVWVPTPKELVSKMLELAEVRQGDILMDLGSGDGITVIAAAKKGARSIGIEFNPDMVALSRENAIKEGVSDRTEFKEGDLFEADLSDATVITMFLLPQINLKLRPKLLDLRAGTRIVSNTFTMGEWIPDSSVTTEENWNSWNTAFLWIVPAKAGGIWKMGNGELRLDQTFQVISGTFVNGGATSEVNGGRLRGDKISFIINGNKYSGIVNGNTMRGIFTNDSLAIMADWAATKKGDQ
jgi:hypothetical protein